ncbi:hypothetical protein [Caulobacter sp. DWR1-3-2b1]|uniref:hypothetical protein n=1 Tax=Caulobacter sp. DWR1-3-2b1 TaxID=2804670 RepID=UPI003CFAA86F
MIVAMFLVLALQDDGRDYRKYYDEDRAVAVSAPLLGKCFGSRNSAACAAQALDVCIGPWRQQLAINICARTQRDLVRELSLSVALSARSRSAFIRWERAQRARVVL